MTEPAQPDRIIDRRVNRVPFEAKVQFRAGNRRADVMVQDISKLGARISGVFLVREDDRFYLKIGTLEPIESRVVWVTDFEFGCEFLKPLSDVIAEAVTARRI